MPSRSHYPTLSPTRQPVILPPSSVSANWQQEFLAGASTDLFFNNTEEMQLMTLFASYTDDFASPNHEVEGSSCQFSHQVMSRQWDDPANTLLTVFYSCEWTFQGSALNVASFPSLYQNFMNNNLQAVLVDVQAIFPHVIKVLSVQRRLVLTPAPTTQSIAPSAAP